MKKIRKIKVQDVSQTVYMKMLQSLRSTISAEYSKVLNKETRGMVLGYD
jgi:hypothetical protein